MHRFVGSFCRKERTNPLQEAKLHAAGSLDRPMLWLLLLGAAMLQIPQQADVD